MQEVLQDFLKSHSSLDVVEVISYRPLPPRCVRIAGNGGESIYLTTEMRDFGNRIEIGALRILFEWTQADEKAEIREQFPGGQVVASRYLRSPGFDHVSGALIRFSDRDLVVVPGDAPYSIFLGFGEISRGRPEFPIAQYTFAD